MLSGTHCTVQVQVARPLVDVLEEQQRVHLVDAATFDDTIVIDRQIAVEIGGEIIGVGRAVAGRGNRTKHRDPALGDKRIAIGLIDVAVFVEIGRIVDVRDADKGVVAAKGHVGSAGVFACLKSQKATAVGSSTVMLEGDLFRFGFAEYLGDATFGVSSEQTVAAAIPEVEIAT